MCKIPERGDTEMHFNRIVIAVVGDRTELRICFHFVWSLDSFPPPTSKKTTTLFTFLKCQRGLGG